MKKPPLKATQEPHIPSVFYTRPGLGTPIDYDKAFYWLSIAARQIFRMPSTGWQDFIRKEKETAKSERESAYWVKKAAGNGHIDAQRAMGMILHYGLGVHKNLPESVKWFEKAANAGNATAQYYLGMDYMNGNGLAKNEREGEKWLYRAAMQDHLEAQTYLGTIYLKRKLQNEGQPPETALAIQWMENAATRNDPYAIRLLSMVYRHIPELQNNAKGMLHLRRSARWGMHQPNSISEEPCFRIKTHLQNARKLSSGLKKPRQQDERRAQAFLGNMYYYGEFVPVDYVKALPLLMRAADKGDSFAQYTLGLAYIDGNGIAKDERKAFSWLEKSASQNRQVPSIF